MPITEITCDGCGVTTSDFANNLDGCVRCRQCNIAERIDSLERQIADLEFQNQLRTDKIAELNTQIDTLKGTVNG